MLDLNAAIFRPPVHSATLTDRNITLNTGATITLFSNKLHMVLNSDRDTSSGGAG